MGTDFVQGSRAHQAQARAQQAQARAHGQGHKASPDLFSWVSLTVREIKSQFQYSQYSHKFPLFQKRLSAGAGHTSRPRVLSVGFLHQYSWYSHKFPFCQKHLPTRVGHVASPPTTQRYPSNPTQSHLPLVYGAWSILDGVFYRGTAGATQMLNIHLRGRAGHTDFKIPVLSRMGMIAKPRSADPFTRAASEIPFLPKYLSANKTQHIHPEHTTCIPGWWRGKTEIMCKLYLVAVGGLLKALLQLFNHPVPNEIPIVRTSCSVPIKIMR